MKSSNMVKIKLKKTGFQGSRHRRFYRNFDSLFAHVAVSIETHATRQTSVNLQTDVKHHVTTRLEN